MHLPSLRWSSYRSARLIVMVLAIIACSGAAFGDFTWQVPEIADATGFVGQYAAIAVDSAGRPHIAYYDSTNGALRHAFRDTDVWHSEIVDGVGDVGKFADIAIDSQDLCHISYRDVTGGQLKYAFGEPGDWQTEVIGSCAVTAYPSIAVDSLDQPHISYMGGDSGTLCYARRDESQWTVETVDAGPSVGRYTCIALDGLDRPHISYQDFGSFDLKYAYRNDTGWETVRVETQNSVGSYSSLALDADGWPHIAHCDTTNLDLRYAYYDGAQWHHQAVDSPGNIGRFCSIDLLPSGWPCISYLDYDSRDLRFACEDTYGWHTLTLDGPNDVGWYSSLALDRSGNAHIAYFDDTNDDLLYIFGGAPPDTTPPSTPVVQDDGAYTMSTSELHASWSSTDPDSAITGYSYAIGASPGSDDVLAWSQAVSSTAVTQSELALVTGTRYYFSVKARNGAGLWSDVGLSDGILVVRSVDTPGAARALTEGSWVLLDQLVVGGGTEAFGDHFYAQDPDRSSGIKVVLDAGTPIDVLTGQRVSVAGRLSTLEGESAILEPEITVSPNPGSPPNPLGLAQGSLGVGLNNTGLLVKVWGKITAAPAGDSYFYVDDGSNLQDGSGNTGIKVYGTAPTDPVGKRVSVIGVSGIELDGDTPIPVIRTRGTADVVGQS